jgi:hypothetical protein
MLPKKRSILGEFLFLEGNLWQNILSLFLVYPFPFFTQKKPETDADLRAKTCLEIQH